MRTRRGREAGRAHDDELGRQRVAPPAVLVATGTPVAPAVLAAPPTTTLAENPGRKPARASATHSGHTMEVGWMLYPQHSLLAFPENHAGGALVAPVSREMIGVAGAEHRPEPVAMGGGANTDFRYR